MARCCSRTPLNFFHLASPDLLLGFEAPVAQRNIIGVIEAFPEVGKWAIFIRKFGQQVIAATGGRRIHPRLCIPGGVNQNLSVEHRDALRGDVDQIIAWCCDALALHKRFVRAHEALHETFASFPSSYMSLVGADGAMDLYDGALRAIDADGADRSSKDVRAGGVPRLHGRGGSPLELHEVPAHPLAGPRGGLV